MLTKLSCLLLLVAIIMLIITLARVNKHNEPFAYNYDEKCIDTCRTQSTNADNQCINDCQMPCNNKCWKNCFKKSTHFDDYLRCGVRCPVQYFNS